MKKQPANTGANKMRTPLFIAACGAVVLVVLVLVLLADDSHKQDHAAKIKRALEIQYAILPESRPTPDPTP